MAKPFVANHNGKISSYIQRKTVSLPDLRTPVMVKTSKGFVLEGELQLREYPNFNLYPSITFVGSIKLAEETPFCVVSVQDLIVWEMSKAWQQFFMVEFQLVRNLEYNICTIFPHFEKWKEVISRGLSESTEFNMNTGIPNENGTGELSLSISFINSLQNQYYRIALLVETTRQDSYVDDTDQQQRKRLSVKVQKEETQSSDDASSVFDSDREDSTDGSMQASDAPATQQPRAENSGPDRKSAHLLKHGLQRNGIYMHPKLNFFISSVIFLLATLCIIGIIVQLLWSALTINRFEASIDLLTVPVRRTFTEGSYSSEMLEHIRRNSFFLTEDEIAHEFQRLKVTWDLSHKRTQTLRTILHDSRKGLTEEELSGIIRAKVDLINFSGTHVTIDINDAIHMYNMVFTMLLNSTMEDIESEKWVLNFLKANRESNIPNVWSTACSNVLDTQRRSEQNVEMVEFSFMIAAITLATGFFLVVFFPVMYFVLKLKLEVFRVFEMIDKDNLKEISRFSRWKLTEFGGVNKIKDLEVEDALMSKTSTIEDWTHKEGTEKPEAKRKESKITIPFKDILFSVETRYLYILLCFTIAYYLGFYLWWRHARSALIDDMPTRIYQSQLRNWYCRKLTESIVHWDDESHSINLNLTDVKYYEDQIRVRNHVLYYGDREWNISNGIFELEGGEEHFSGSICEQVRKNPVPGYNFDGCEQYRDSVLTRGSYETYLDLLHVSEDLRKTYNNHGINATFPLIHTLRDYADHWIPQVSTMYDRWLFDVFKQGFTSASMTRTVGTVGYIALCVLLGVFVYFPMTKKLNTDIGITRGILAIIPPIAFEKSPKVKMEVRRLAIQMIQNK
jgi:hypothetical protein